MSPAASSVVPPGRRTRLGRRGGSLAALLVLAATPLAGQTSDRPLLPLLPASARYAGLAGASAALLGDAAGVFKNPAGLATIRHVALEGTGEYYQTGAWEVMAAAAVRIAQFTLGGGGHYLRFNDTASVKDNLEWAGSAVYRFGFIAIGTTLRYVSVEDRAGQIRRTAAGDGGLALAFFDIAALGISVQNLVRGKVTGDILTLPTTGRLGFSLNFVDPQGRPRLLGTVEGIYTEGEHGRTVFGVEGGYLFHDFGLLARAGYGGQPTGSGLSKGAVGASLVLTRVKFDYSFQELELAGGGVHRVGLRLTL